MLVLSASEQKKALTMREAMHAVGTALIASSLGQTVTPIRTNIPISNRGSALFMPSLVESSRALGVKFVSVIPGNKALGKKTIYGVMVLADVQTAEPLALVEASYLTKLRTGAVVGLATNYLARKESTVLGVIGTGAQARGIIEAICTVRDIHEIRLYNRSIDKARELEIELLLQKYGRIPSVHVVRYPKDAVKGVDIIVTATNSEKPVFTIDDLDAHVHINAIGSYRPDMQELPAELFDLRPKVVVESIHAAYEETGDFIIPKQQARFKEEDIYAELGDIVRGNQSGRVSSDEITVFKSVGLASMDVVIGQVLYERAIELNLGHIVCLE